MNAEVIKTDQRLFIFYAEDADRLPSHEIALKYVCHFFDVLMSVRIKNVDDQFIGFYDRL